ncbi:hypothetical protein LMG29542_06551 [Paraburkholderia humisilvae]|uniref:Uncharacterized protein n=1 Tax=Paraburkholderia humisilvae TaxID=627669 RepID=A0A6J5F0H0_9BURK|nr:hypothetical protein LMG29542_06551 [Paraburkholderia humisilvae]
MSANAHVISGKIVGRRAFPAEQTGSAWIKRLNGWMSAS